jgi:hypothetical protein
LKFLENPQKILAAQPPAPKSPPLGLEIPAALKIPRRPKIRKIDFFRVVKQTPYMAAFELPDLKYIKNPGRSIGFLSGCNF